MINFYFITIFPEILRPYLSASIIGRAEKNGKISLSFYNPRDFALSGRGGKAKKATYAERRVDERPYGGGPGMVIEALPILRAIESAVGKKLSSGSASKKVKIIFLSPSGKQFTNIPADSLKKFSALVLVCGRYEGIDARVRKAFPLTEISVGPYVLTGGELPAMIMIDAVPRRIPGVLGKDESL